MLAVRRVAVLQRLAHRADQQASSRRHLQGVRGKDDQTVAVHLLQAWPGAGEMRAQIDADATATAEKFALGRVDAEAAAARTAQDLGAISKAQLAGLEVQFEQQRYAIQASALQQRLALRKKGVDGRLCPHQLIMTATPIPRTLAMSAYADLDTSILDELPPGAPRSTPCWSPTPAASKSSNACAVPAPKAVRPIGCAR